MYSELSDNELLELINEQKDNDAMETLIKRYGPMITGQSRSLYIIGADEEDRSDAYCRDDKGWNN